MKGRIVAIILLLNFTSFQALNAQWAKTYGGSENDTASSILQTRDGGYIILGSTESFGFGDGYSDIWVLKIASDGIVEWQKVYAKDYTNNAFSIQQTTDGGFIIGGSIGGGGLGHQFWIIKLLPDGKIEWQNNYGDDSINYAYSLQQTSDGGYIVLGNRGLNDAARFDFLILKLSFYGTVEWSKTYGGSVDDNPSSILQTSEGGFIVTGYTKSYGAGDSDIWILKLFPDGMIEWQKTYGGSKAEIAYSIQQTNDRGYILAGNNLSSGAGGDNFWVLKLSSGGNIEWNKTYGGSKTETAYSIQQSFDGGFIVAGETNSFGAGNKDIWILKLNILGEIEWQKTYGGREDDEALFIQQTYDGGYVVAGSTDTYGAGEGDFLILRLSSNGDISPSCTLINESNAGVSEIDISPVDTYIDGENIDIISADIDITEISVQESEAVVYSLCSEVKHTLNMAVSAGGKTVPQPGMYQYDYAESINISAMPDIGYKFSGWTGDISDSRKSMSITMDSDKSIQANFELNVLDEIWERVKRTPCFIATAAYGSPNHPHVQALQDFRDKYLIPNKLGRRFVSIYYKYSPYIAEFITKHKPLRTVVRLWLLPVVALGYSMVHFGPVLTALLLAVTFLAPFLIVCLYRRRREKE